MIILYQILKKNGGTLCWYDSASNLNYKIPGEIVSSNYLEWLNKYEELSKHTCICCGRKAEIINFHGWYEPICKKCQRKFDK